MSQEIELGAIINTSPRPRMLIRGFHSDKERLIADLFNLCPTVKHIQSLREVRQAEWDLLVTDQELGEAEKYVGITKVATHLFVIYCAQQGDYHRKIEGRQLWDADIVATPGKISQEIRRVRNLPERIATLTHEQLEPVLKLRESHRNFQHNIRTRASNTGLRI